MSAQWSWLLDTMSEPVVAVVEDDEQSAGGINQGCPPTTTITNYARLSTRRLGVLRVYMRF